MKTDCGVEKRLACELKDIKRQMESLENFFSSGWVGWILVKHSYKLGPNVWSMFCLAWSNYSRYTQMARTGQMRGYKRSEGN
jgi:hypothetical protein